jgi:hypothetical protein
MQLTDWGADHVRATSGSNAVWAAVLFRAVPIPPIAMLPMTGRCLKTSGTAGRSAPIINVGMSSRDPGGCRLPPITPNDDAAADPTPPAPS